MRVGESTLVDDASLSVKTGEFVAILGPNGAGKTTLLRTMLGLADAVSGSSELDGDDCATLPPVERARRVFGPFMERWGYELPSEWSGVSAWGRLQFFLLAGPRYVYWRFIRLNSGLAGRQLRRMLGLKAFTSRSA